jgi:serine/threonine protein kinase/DNA-binding CsgD family transcriptional regulator
MLGRMATTRGACPPETVLAAFVAGALAHDEVSPVEEHLSSCDDCRRILAVVERTSDTRAPADPASSDPTLPSGSTAGRYVLQSLLGVGGMGQVFEARDPELARKVAIKILDAGGTDDEAEQLAARMRREAQAMAMLSHPNVVAVHDVGTVEGRVFVAMEYVQGSTLRRWLGTERPWAEVLAVLEQAGRGLAAAHGAGLVHRDFKPDNVLVGDDGRVRVTDFGLATAAEDVRSRGGTLAGTPPYMAPEALAGGPVDARSDIFGFCVTLYEALYGARPFAGRTVEELKESIASGNVREVPDRDVPTAIRRALLAGLRADPAERYATLDELLDLLGASSTPRTPGGRSTSERSHLETIWEAANAATSLESFRRSLVALVRSIVDFDTAVIIPSAPWIGDDSGLGATNVGIAPDLFDSYLRHRSRYYLSLYPLMTAMLQNGGLAVDRDVLRERAQREQLDVYREVLLPAGVTSYVACSLTFQGRASGVLTVNRHDGRAPFAPGQVEALRALLGPMAVADTAVAARQRPTDPPWTLPAAALTPRENEVAQLLVAGLQNKEIAAALGTSIETVRKQSIRVYEKLGVSGRHGLVRQLSAAAPRGVGGAR